MGLSYGFRGVCLSAGCVSHPSLCCYACGAFELFKPESTPWENMTPCGSYLFWGGSHGSEEKRGNIVWFKHKFKALLVAFLICAGGLFWSRRVIVEVVVLWSCVFLDGKSDASLRTTDLLWVFKGQTRATPGGPKQTSHLYCRQRLVFQTGLVLNAWLQVEKQWNEQTTQCWDST